jgi:hypothetical protein
MPKNEAKLRLMQGRLFSPAVVDICSGQGPIFQSENDIYSPSCDMSFFNSHRWPFCLNHCYFAFILPFFTSSFFISFPFLFFFFPLFPFLLHFPPITLPLFTFPPPQMTLADTPPLGGGEGYYPIYRPLGLPALRNFNSHFSSI